MNSKQKKEWVWNKIVEICEISPIKYIAFDLVNVIDIESNNGVPDCAPVSLSINDQISVLKKFEVEGLITFLSFDLNEGSAYFVVQIDVSSGFEKDIKKVEKEKNILSVETIGGALSIDSKNGIVIYDGICKEYSLLSKNFILINKLITSKDYSVSYVQILNSNANKDSKRQFSFTLRNLKEDLGILPKSKTSKKDFLETVRGYGVKILIKQDTEKKIL